FGGGDVFSQVPAEGMNGFRLVRRRLGAFLSFIADTPPRAARTVVVVATLHDDEIPRLNQGQYAVPVSLRDNAASASAANRAVDHVNLPRIERGGERIAPAELTV